MATRPFTGTDQRLPSCNNTHRDAIIAQCRGPSSSLTFLPHFDISFSSSCHQPSLHPFLHPLLVNRLLAASPLASRFSQAAVGSSNKPRHWFPGTCTIAHARSRIHPPCCEYGESGTGFSVHASPPVPEGRRRGGWLL